MNPSKVKIIAHRGNSSEAPENSAAAFKSAIKLNVDYLECDVQLSKDNIPVIMHDKTFERITTNLHVHNINELTYKEILRIDIGSWFSPKFYRERIMTLDHFLRMPKNKMGMMIEIKKETVFECPLANYVGETIKKYTRSYPDHGPILVGSLNPDILYCLEGYLPEIQLIAVVENMEDLEKFKGLNPKVFGFQFSLLNPDLIKSLKEEGAEVWAWTVDDKQEGISLIQQGVTGIITNMPKKMMHII